MEITWEFWLFSSMLLATVVYLIVKGLGDFINRDKGCDLDGLTAFHILHVPENPTHQTLAEISSSRPPKTVLFQNYQVPIEAVYAIVDCGNKKLVVYRRVGISTEFKYCVTQHYATLQDREDAMTDIVIEYYPDVFAINSKKIRGEQ